jgi:hypothetical protein
MQPAIEGLVKLGPLPPAKAPDILPRMEKIEELVYQVSQPLTDDEARALCKLFGPDECYGLAWSFVQMIESAPGWPLRDVMQETGNYWIDRMRYRTAAR